MFFRNCYSYSNFTIPHPTCVGSPLPRNVGPNKSAIADILGCTVPLRPYSLPRDFSTALEMTGLNTVTQCCGRTRNAPTTLYQNVSTGFANLPTAARRRADACTTNFLGPSPLGEGGTSVSKVNRVTNEGSGYDERNIKDNPSSVATRQLPPKGKP